MKRHCHICYKNVASPQCEHHMSSLASSVINIFSTKLRTEEDEYECSHCTKGITWEPFQIQRLHVNGFSPVSDNIWLVKSLFFLWKSIVIFATRIWFSPVSVQMFFIITVRWKTLVTLETHKWLLPSVCQHMSCEITAV